MARPEVTTLDDVHRVDAEVYSAIARTPTPVLDRFMSRLSHAANYARFSIAAAALLALTRGAEGRRAARLGLAAVGVTSVVTNVALKPLLRRSRPDRAEVLPSRFGRVAVPASRSFPSGHSASAFAFATGVGRALPGSGAALRGLAAAVAYSRVHTGVHYPGDVVAGAVVGTVLAQGTAHVLERASRGAR